MSSIQLIGIGSPFGDDQAGWKVIDILKEKNNFKNYIPRRLNFMTLDRPGINLLACMDINSIIILIDAMKSGCDIGSLHRYENPQLHFPETVLSTHGMGVIQALQLGLALDQLPKKLIFYGIEIGKLTKTSDISHAIETAILILAERLEDELLTLLNEK